MLKIRLKSYISVSDWMFQYPKRAITLQHKLSLSHLGVFFCRKTPQENKTCFVLSTPAQCSALKTVGLSATREENEEGLGTGSAKCYRRGTSHA